MIYSLLIESGFTRIINQICRIQRHSNSCIDTVLRDCCACTNVSGLVRNRSPVVDAITKKIDIHNDKFSIFFKQAC